MTHRLKPLCLALAGLTLGAAASLAFAEEMKKETTKLDKITVEGEATAIGGGQMVQEDAGKARSTSGRLAIEKQRATANPFQLLQYLPGVNSFSHDGSGLFGGGMTIRGFNSDQLGFTIDGAPVNDSGSYSVFPQEYSDSENLEEVFATQGTADTDSPHVGATGGNVGVSSGGPLDRTRFKLSQTFGSNSLSRTFARFDTGKLANFAKVFVSYSQSDVDKFRGLGKADRTHIDSKVVFDLGPKHSLALGLLWNDAVNNNYRTVTKAQYEQNGRYFDFTQTYRGHLAGVRGTRQDEQNNPAVAADTDYRFALNPFQNALWTIKGKFQLSPVSRLDVEPYFWYGYGGGGIQQFYLNEGGTFRGGIQDLNGDGDRLDRVLVYRASMTQTHRPGATVRFYHQLDNHRLMVGYWYERARHKQFGPASFIDNGGTVSDIWLRNNLVLRGDGSAFQLRDWLTISTADQLFGQDSMTFLDDRLTLTLGARAPRLKREFNNYANEGTNQGVDYKIEQTFKRTLPNFAAKFQFDPKQHVYFNVAQNFKAPGNFIYGSAYQNGQIRFAEGIKPETSWNYDLGYRFQSDFLTFSGSLFYVDWSNRLARRYDSVLGASFETNVGKSTAKGFEVEAGTKVFRGFSAYTSLSYTDSKLKDDLPSAVNVIQPTAGKVFPNTPKWMSALTVQYATGGLVAALQAKYTGKRYATLTNDESVPGFTLVDLNVGYTFPNGFLKKPTLRLNVSNLFDKEYLSLNASSGSLITTNATGPGASAPSYYVGSPRFSSLSFSAEF